MPASGRRRQRLQVYRRASVVRRQATSLKVRASAVASMASAHRALVGDRLASAQASRARLRGLLHEVREACATRPNTVLTPSARRRAPWPPTSSDRHADGHLDKLHALFAATRDDGVRAELAAAYDSFAVKMARRFPSRRETFEDLVQVARIGLLHALDRYEPDRGRPFLVFARVTISGELRRHVRDHTWGMRVPRSLQERYLEVVRAVDDLTQSGGRSPRIDEIVARVGLSDEDVLEAMELGRAQRPLSFDAPAAGDDAPVLEPGTEDAGFAGVDQSDLLSGLVARLPERERLILRLRFAEEMTQAQIAARLGVSQMYVSRLLARTLTRMRSVADASRAEGGGLPRYG